MKRIALVLALQMVAALILGGILSVFNDGVIPALVASFIPAYAAVWAVDTWSYERSPVEGGYKTNVLPLYASPIVAALAFVSLYAITFILVSAL